MGIASFKLIDKNNYHITFPIYTLEGKPIIFLSGIGNELIRILQIHPLFSKWEFIIFNSDPEDETFNKEVDINVDHFQLSLEDLYTKAFDKKFQNTLEIPSTISASVYRLSAAKMNKQSARKDAQKQAEEAIEEFFNKNEKLNPEKTLLKIPHMIQNTLQDYKQALDEFRHNFCHSEQALRYYLYAHIERLLPIKVSKDTLLVLSIHSERDPCKYCTHALFMETFLHDKKSFKGRRETTGGFFHKSYNENPESIPQVFIFASSHKSESQGGLTRRLLAGKALDPQINHPISIDSETRLFFRHNGPTLPH